MQIVAFKPNNRNAPQHHQQNTRLTVAINNRFSTSSYEASDEESSTAVENDDDCEYDEGNQLGWSPNDDDDGVGGDNSGLINTVTR